MCLCHRRDYTARLVKPIWEGNACGEDVLLEVVIITLEGMFLSSRDDIFYKMAIFLQAEVQDQAHIC